MEQITKNKVSQKIKELKTSPLFAISLSSKELFHSNFWAWLIDQKASDGKNPYIEVFMPGFYSKGYSVIAVEREKKNMDVCITYLDKYGNKSVCVIENKIKSIPDIEQLKIYEDKLKKKNLFGKGILTGLKETLNIEELDDWEFLSYIEIATRIKEISNRNLNMQYSDYVKQYVHDITCLNYIFETKLENVDDKYIYKDSDLEEIRFSDILIKLKGSEFVQKINNALKYLHNELKINDDWLVPIAEFSFNNKKPTITVVYQEFENGKQDCELRRLGVQIEGDAFRIYGGGEKLGINNEGEVYNRLIEYNYLDAKFKSRLSTDGHTTRMRKTYCKYGGKISDEYCHIYQYWNIEKNDYDSLINEIITQLKIAKLRIEQGLTFKK